MKLNVSTAIRTPGQSYAFSEQQAMAAMEISGTEVSFDDVIVKGTFEALDDGTITVEGSLSTVAHAPCANCLAPASAAVENTFRENFVRDGDPEDDEIFVYSGSQLDLDKLIMSYIVLAMPMRFLCKDGCSGMADWVKDDRVCLCQEEELPMQRPFAALQQLLDEKSGQ